MKVNAKTKDTIAADKIGCNISINPNIAPRIPSAKSQPHVFEPEDFSENEFTERIILVEIIQKANIKGIAMDRETKPLPINPQIPKSVDKIPPTNSHHDLFPFSSPQNADISEIPEISIERQIKNAILTMFTVGVNKSQIPNAAIRIPEKSINHLSVFISSFPFLLRFKTIN